MSNPYELIEVLGNGSFGVITKVKRRSDGLFLVRKDVDFGKMSEKEKQQLVNEVNILRELSHPHIVKYYDRVVDRQKSSVSIIMEFCEGGFFDLSLTSIGDLAAVIKRCKREGKHIPEPKVWKIMSQLVIALHECHHGGDKSRPPILHRDIKPENVFLDSKQNVKLGDFGLSTRINDPDHDFARTYVGTPYYMSPELVDEKCYNTKSDIWALGCLIYELCTLQPPFQAKTQIALSTKIRTGQFQSLPMPYSRDLNNVIRATLMIQPEKRASTIDLLQHPKIREYANASTALPQLMDQLSVKEHHQGPEPIHTRHSTPQSSKEDALNEKERRLKEKEEYLYRKEQSLQKKEQELAAFERALQEKARILQSSSRNNSPTIPRKPLEEKKINGLLDQTPSPIRYKTPLTSIPHRRTEFSIERPSQNVSAFSSPIVSHVAGLRPKIVNPRKYTNNKPGSTLL